MRAHFGKRKKTGRTQSCRLRDTKYKIRTYDPIRVKDVLYH